MPDPSNRGSGSFGGTHLPQEQNVSGGFRDQKSGVGASGDFGGCGMSQQDRGTKSGGSETSGKFGDHIVGQRSAIGGPMVQNMIVLVSSMQCLSMVLDFLLDLTRTRRVAPDLEEAQHHQNKIQKPCTVGQIEH